MMRYLLGLLLMLIVGCSSENNTLIPDEVGLPRAPQLAGAGSYGWPTGDVFTDNRHYNVRSIMIDGEMVLDEGKGLYGLAYIYSEKNINCGTGYMVEGKYVLTGRAINPGMAEHITATPTAADFNALADKYNLLVTALQLVKVMED